MDITKTNAWLLYHKTDVANCPEWKMIKALPSSVTRATTVSDIFCRTLQQISSASIRTQIRNLWQNKLSNLQNKKSPATTPGIQQTIWENNVASKNFQCGLKILHSKKKKNQNQIISQEKLMIFISCKSNGTHKGRGIQFWISNPR